jgi:deoxyadenosine/deoxycytidine kinase
MVRISIDGAIGVGKTTVINMLKKDNHIVNPEDTDKWNDWLQLYHSDMTKYAYSFQSRILFDKMCQPYTTNKINIYERSPFTLHNMFGKLLHTDNMINDMEYELEEMYIERLAWKPDYIIYLSSDIDTTIERIKNHSVTANKNISIDYLKKVHLLHEIVFDPSTCPIKIFKIYASTDINTVYENVKQVIYEIEKNEFMQ